MHEKPAGEMNTHAQIVRNVPYELRQVIGQEVTEIRTQTCWSSLCLDNELFTKCQGVPIQQ